MVNAKTLINSCDTSSIAKTITKMSGKYSPDTIFRDWVKMAALAISNSCHLFHNKLWNKRENDFNGIANKYTKEENITFSNMLAELVVFLEKYPSDYLGKIYMEADAGNKNAGQFFTPFDICDLMARMTIDKIHDDNISLYEPACGGGGMLIAELNQLKDKGINYQRKVKIIAQDLDETCVYMTYIQLSLMGANAICVIGSTLSEPYEEGKPYPQERVFRTPNNMGLLI